MEVGSLDRTNGVATKTVHLKNAAVSTSGDTEQFVEIGGKRYSHIIDPRTGYGVTQQRNVTILAKDGAAADWLATACSILPIRRAKKLVRKEKASLLIAEWKKGRLVLHSVNGFDDYYEAK